KAPRNAGLFFEPPGVAGAANKFRISSTRMIGGPLVRNACLILAALAGTPLAIADDQAITPFSTSSPGPTLPAPWRISLLPSAKRATEYSLVADGGTVVLRAAANASIASVMHPLKVDPEILPYITWRWNVANILRKSDINRKAGDDFPARVYVLFDYDVSKLSMLQWTKIFLARRR